MFETEGKKKSAREKQKRKNTDYLKYWRLVRFYIKERYGLCQEDLDMMLFLYTEGYFRAKRFRDYEKIFPWDKERFFKLRKEGWIEIFRNGTGKKGDATLYHLTNKGARVVTKLYKYLNGEEEIPEDPKKNPMFKEDAGFVNKTCRYYITNLNKAKRQQRYRASR